MAWNDSSKANALIFLIFPPGPFFSLLILFLLFTSFWSVSVLYLVWLFLDWDTPKQGKRCRTCAQEAETVAGGRPGIPAMHLSAPRWKAL